jgi:hypothetical protein
VAVVGALAGGHAAHTLTELATVHDRMFRRHVGDVIPEGGALTRTDVGGESGGSRTYRDCNDEHGWQRSAEKQDDGPPWMGAPSWLARQPRLQGPKVLT